MPSINIFITDPSEKTYSFLKQYENRIGCVTLPYEACSEGWDSFPQAVLLSDNTLPNDLSEKHPNVGAVFSHHPVPCDLPNIQCNSEGEFICLCLSPPDNKHFIPPGLTEDWAREVESILKGRDPETVTVELCAGAYDIPFPYDGTFQSLTVSEALSLARRCGAVLNMNKNSYYSYFIYSCDGHPHIVFLSSATHYKNLLQRFLRLGIKRFAGSDAELSDKEMREVLSFFGN